MTNYLCNDCNNPIKLNQEKCKYCGAELKRHKAKDDGPLITDIPIKWVFFVGVCIIIIVFYISSFSSSNFLTSLYSILTVIPLRFLGDKRHKEANFSSMVYRIRHYRTEYKTRAIISGILFLLLFSWSFITIAGNFREHRIAIREQEAYDKAMIPTIEILSKEGNIGNVTGYTLVYKTKDATNVVIGNQTFSGNDKENSVNFSLDGLGNHTLNILILAKNEYRSSERKLSVVRDKTAQEIKLEKAEQLRIEKEKKEEELRALNEKKRQETERLQEESSNRQQYASLLRERYLDKGLDIKVSVKGKYSTTLALTYVLMGDVAVHQLREAQEIEREGMGFARVDFYDGYGYHAWVIFQ